MEESTHLTEEQALAQAADEGIKFRDFYKVEGSTTEYDTYGEAAEAAKELKLEDALISQIRTQDHTPDVEA